MCCVVLVIDGVTIKRSDWFSWHRKVVTDIVFTQVIACWGLNSPLMYWRNHGEVVLGCSGPNCITVLFTIWFRMGFLRNPVLGETLLVPLSLPYCLCGRGRVDSSPSSVGKGSHKGSPHICIMHNAASSIIPSHEQ